MAPVHFFAASVASDRNTIFLFIPMVPLFRAFSDAYLTKTVESFKNISQGNKISRKQVVVECLYSSSRISTERYTLFMDFTILCFFKKVNFMLREMLDCSSSPAHKNITSARAFRSDLIFLSGIRHLFQYRNEYNPIAHYDTTAEEIYHQMEGKK